MNDILFDQPIFNQARPYDPFALTDVFTEHVGQHQQRILHFWQYEHTFILGMKDTRVPHFKTGIQEVLQADYFPVIRNSGGLGVISDKGILNVSLIFPKTEQTTTDSAYEEMLLLTRLAFPELEISAYEIPTSYCPGTYDLSVDGKKIAGIAQRRVKNGVAVMMYLSVNGNQFERGEIVRRFYQQSLKEAEKELDYPKIDSLSMITVEDVLARPITIEEVKQRYLSTLAITNTPQTPEIWLHRNQYTTKFDKKIQSMAQRNIKLKEIYNEYSL